MERKRKIVKVHYYSWGNSERGLCGIKVRDGTNLTREVTCGNCLKKLQGKISK